jgi:hypothetical protein
LLVVEGFRDSAGMEWRPGDRAPLARRAVREAAARNPDWFMVEFSTEPLDPAADWFRELAAQHERRYEELKLLREGAEERRQQALREEMAQQNIPQPELERRFKQQEKERAEQQERMLEQRQRDQIERSVEVELGVELARPGFHRD